MALADLRELGRGQRVDRFEGDETAAELLQRGDRAHLLLFIGLVIESDAGRIGKRLLLGEAKLRTHLLLEQPQRSRRAFFLDGELSALAAKLREPLARLGQSLLRFPARAFRGERSLPRKLRGTRSFLRIRRGSSEILLRRLETAA